MSHTVLPVGWYLLEAVKNVTLSHLELSATSRATSRGSSTPKESSCLAALLI